MAQDTLACMHKITMCSAADWQCFSKTTQHGPCEENIGYLSACSGTLLEEERLIFTVQPHAEAPYCMGDMKSCE